jgi:3-isopropylmalate/(R)-2-methylmalate dehydratase large subunit
MRSDPDARFAATIRISAINRNFPGRSGPGKVWLVSPATVAASVIAGRLRSFAELRDDHAAIRYQATPS